MLFTIFLAPGVFSRYFGFAAWGSHFGCFWFTAKAEINLGAGPKAGNVSVNDWQSRPGQFRQNEH